jgi:LPS O-antigen subunit length determinant protein (WzzB/FepE family)
VFQDNLKADSSIRERDIDLVELFRIIWKGKIFMISVVLLFTILAYFYSSVKPKIYEVDTIIEIASIIGEDDINTIESAELLIAKADFIYNKNLPDKELTRLKNIASVIGAPRLVEITVASTSNDKARDLVNKIFKDVGDHHLVLIENYKSTLQKKLKFSRAQYKKLVEDEKTLMSVMSKKEEMVHSLIANNGEVAAVYSLNLSTQSNTDELHEIKTNIYEIEEDILSQEIALLPENIRETKLLSEIKVKNNSVSPKVALIMILGLIIGFVMSLLLLVLYSFLKQNQPV